MRHLIFGDNQFFGINHMSEDKAQAQLERFATLEPIIDIIDAAYEAGIRRFMFTTHERVAEICNHFRSRPDHYADLLLYPAMPYGHKYANLVTEKGMVGAVAEVVRGTGSTSAAINTAFRVGMGVLVNQDVIEMMRLLVDAEMQMFRGLRVEAILLQNVVTDLLYGLKAKRVFKEFALYVRKKYSAEPGFITMNLPGLVEFLHECEVPSPLVCASFNKAGYLMNPTRGDCENTVRSGRCRFVAMSIFASGAISPAEAVEYVDGYDNVEAVLFGASSRQHIEHTRSLLEDRQAFLSRGVHPSVGKTLVMAGTSHDPL
jgi:hypothetical protein